MSKNSLGKILKQIRKSKGLTQAQLGEIAGANEKHISKIETGVYFPTYSTLNKILKALDLSIEDIDITEESYKLKNSQYYIKSLQIIKSSSSEKELEYYYGILKQAQIGYRMLQNK